jgi:predicted dehydrogenase
MGEVIGIGVVGCGMMAQLHTSSLAMLQASGMPIRAVAAADPDPAARAATQHNWPFDRLHADAGAVLADPEVDAVYVCTPTSLHHELYVGAFEAGKHLYAEKPLAPTLELARSIAAACPPATICQVGFQTRRHALIAEVRRLVHSGELGPVMAYLFRDDQSFPTTSITPYSSEWRSRREIAGGGTLLEHSIHSVDLLHWIFGAPASVTARTRHSIGLEVEDTAALLVEHDSGLAGTLVSVYGCVQGREESRLEVFCRDGVIEVTWGVLVESEENRLRVQRSGEPAVDYDPLAVLDAQLASLGLSERPFFCNELASRAFIESLLARQPASPGLEDALAAHATVEAAYRSAASGMPERVEAAS